MKNQKPQQLEQINTSWMLPGTPCWVQIATEDSESFPDLFAPAEVQELQDQKVTVRYLKHEGLPNPVDVAIVFQQNVIEPEGFTDMVVMEVLNEAEILNNIRYRYAKDEIFTYIGPTLMVMNPYKSMESRLGPDVLKIYQNQSRSPQPFNLRDTPPHTYAIAANAYKKLFDNSRNQAIVISGESGAGKTENAKIAMRFLTSLSEAESNIVVEQSERIEEKIMACNPILESFGNAKTVRNDNSSRFGKYVRIIVNSESRRIKGAAINNYLLEKSRVVQPGPQERNYHVFYNILKGASEEQLKALRLVKGDGSVMKAEDFEILRIGECIEVAAINDKRWYDDLVSSFQNIQFSKEEMDTVLQTLAAVMLLGNLKFDTSTLTDKNPCGFSDNLLFQNISYLLGIPEDEMRKTLTIKTREVGKTLIESPLNEADAYSNRNALAANLYDRLFSWLVKRLNLTIIPKEDLQQSDIRKSIRMIKRQSILGIKLSIGLLDIFGFENFKHNSFEQYSINYTNEKLQQLYISYVFKSEEQEFIQEGLGDQLSQLNYSDNQAVIDLMDKPPTGIFDLIDEATQLGSGTDDALYQKIIKTHKDNKLVVVPKTAKDKFSIVHTAKTVEYTITGFRGKNKSEISGDLVKGIMASTNELLQLVFLVLCGKEVANKAEELEKIKKPAKTDKFLGAKFRQQMKQLMDELSSSDCHFVRCIKPNELKKADTVIASYCLLQIKYLGVLESIKVRKEGFPYRKDYKVFYQQFHEICPKYRQVSIFKQKGDMQAICSEIVKEVAPEALLLAGKTKFFAKDKLGRQLDQALADWIKKKNELVKKIQRTYKTYLFKKQFKKYLHELVLKIRKFYRIMAHFRRRRQRKIFLAKKKSIQIANKVYWRIAQRSALYLYADKIYCVRKAENQRKALQSLIGTLYHAKVRRAFKDYNQQCKNVKKMFKALTLMQSEITKRKLASLRHLKQQTKLKWEAEERRRQEEERRRQEEERRRQEEERIRQEEERRRIEEEERKRLEEERKRLEEERRRLEEEEARRKEAERQALIQAGLLAEAEKLREQQEREAQERERQRLEDERKRQEAEEERKRQEAEQERLGQQQRDQERKDQERQEQERQEQLRREQDKKEQDRRDQENQAKERNVQKQQDVVKQQTQPVSVIVEEKKLIQQTVEKQDNVSQQNISQKAEQTKPSIATQQQQPQQNISQQPPQQPQVQSQQPQIQSQPQQPQPPTKSEPTKPESIPLARQQTQTKPEIERQQTTQHDRLETEGDDNSSNGDNSPKEALPTYLSQDFFQKPKAQEEQNAPKVVQQSALRKGEANEEDPAIARKRITVSNNILPFVPKDKSLLERFLVSRLQVLPPQYGDLPTSHDFGLNLDKIDKSFMKKVTSSHFLDYCSAVVRKRKKMFSEIPVDKVMQWSSTALEKSLIHLPATLDEKVKVVTQLVYQFAGESKVVSQLEPGQICEQLIRTIFGNHQLIDEVYLLVLKQITKNSTISQIKYCQLLVGLASSVAPSPKALFPIMNYLEIGARAFDKKEVTFLNIAKIPLVIGVQGESVSELLKFAFLRLMKTFSRGRVYPPNATELQLTFLYRQLLVPVYVYHNNIDYVFIEPHFTERQLMEAIVKKFQMYPNWDNLGICRCQGYCETFLEESCLIVDALREIEEISIENKKQGNMAPQPFLAVRIKVFFVFQPQDLDSMCLYFIHFANEYMKGNYPITLEQAALLGTMKMISEHGCYNKNKGQVPKFNPAFYVPSRVLEDKNWAQVLADKYKGFPSVDEMEARGRFLEEIRKFPVFLTWQYPCNYSIKKDKNPSAIILSIRPFQLYICDFDTREIKQRYHFLQVILWGQQKDIVTIETDDGLEHSFKMYRGVDDAVGFNSIMKTYMDRALLQQEGV